MILGTGIDVVALKDVAQELTLAPWHTSDGIFRPSELSHTHPGRASASLLAKSFAVKEAALKALGLPVGNLQLFLDIEVALHTEGTSSVALHGRAREVAGALGVKHILSACHADRLLAVAMVVLEG